MNELNALEKARQAWGNDMPDWVTALAEDCVRRSQRVVAKDIGYSVGVVSQVLNRVYPGNIEKVERAIRGKFLGATVSCPGFYEDISTLTCHGWQIKARGKIVVSSGARTHMWHACRRCPRFKGE